MANSFLHRTLSSTGNRKTWTFSAWIKRSRISNADATQMLFGTYTDGNNRMEIGFHNANNLVFKEKSGGSTNIDFTSTRLFRDSTAWYHIVVAVDTTQSTSSDRVKIYVNGEQITAWNDSTYPSQNYDTYNNLSGRVFNVGQEGSNNYHFQGAMTHVHNVDGAALAATNFGQTDSTSGIWKVKSGSAPSYGTNGLWLKFENSGALGTDSSGQSNTMTVSGNLKQTVNTPSINWCTTLDLHQHNPSNGTFTTSYAGSRFVTNTSSQSMMGIQSFPALKKGKWYAEFKLISEGSGESVVGVMNSINDMQQSSSGFSSNRGYGVASNGAAKYGGSDHASGNWSNLYDDNDIISVALDMDNYRVYFAKNGQYADGSGNWDEAFTGSPAYLTLSSATGKEEYVFAGGDKSTSAATTWEANYGEGFFGITAVASANADGNSQGIFEYAVPSGYYALNTKNIKEYG